MAILKQAIDDLFNPRLALDVALDRHFSPGFLQRVNGAWIDRAAFRAAIAQSRATLVRATITVLDEFVEGPRYSERHVIELVRCDGDRASQEVYVFAQRDRLGRFVRIEELVLALAG